MPALTPEKVSRNPYMIYHVGHERNVFPRLGIPSDEEVVAHALPKIEIGLR